MKIITFILSLLLFTGNLTAQQWQTVGNAPGWIVNAFSYDSINNLLYVAGGTFNIGGVYGTAKWDGSQWSAVGNGVSGGQAFAIKYFNDSVYLGGLYSYHRVSKLHNNAWVTLGQGVCIEYDGGCLPGVQCFEVYNGELYIGGEFKNICNQPCCNNTTDVANGIVRWDGFTLNQVGNPPGVQPLLTFGTCIKTMKAYNGYLYVGGYFSGAGGMPSWSLARWDGTNWSSVTTQILNMINSMVIKDDYIYMGGISGVVERLNLNTLVLDTFGILNNHASVYAIAIYNDDIVIAGRNITTVNGLAIKNIARWNGSSWSSFGTGVTDFPSDDGSINALEVIGCDLYVGGHFNDAGGLTVNSVAKWVEPCITDIKETKNNLKLSIYPNPVSSELNISFTLEKNSVVELQIYNSLGQVLNTITKTKYLSGKNEINISVADLPVGIYHLKFSVNDQMQVKRVVKM